MGQRPYISLDGQAVGSIESSPNCSHPRDQVEYVRERSCGCCSKYHCKACGETFTFEWPD